MGLFGKSKAPDPREQVNDWCRKIRRERSGLDRQIRQIQRGEMEAVRSIKASAKKGDTASARILAREVVNARKAVARIHTTKANMNSVEMQMKAQAAQIRVVGGLQKSAEVMKSMQQLIRVPDIQKTMQEMSKEMMKAGIIEEMMEDAMGGLDEEEELEDDVQREVDKILSELTIDNTKTMARAPAAPDASLRLPEAGADTLAADEVHEDEEEVEEELAEVQARLQALRS